jgi:hypothetical protein
MNLMHPTGLNEQTERRADRRFKASFRVHWGREVGNRAEGEVSDLSVGGCFVVSDEIVDVNDLISLQIEIPGDETLTFWGHIVFWVTDTGFGVRFAPFSHGGARDRLEMIIDGLG